MLRTPRIATRCRVELECSGTRIVTESEDLSADGIFLRTRDLMPVGTVVELHVALPDGSDFRVRARVVHQLGSPAARALGREPGMGLAFIDRDASVRERLLGCLEDLFDSITPLPEEVVADTAVLIVEANPPMRNRLGNALGENGFDVSFAATGADALQMCERRRPDVLLVTATMPRTDGWALASVVLGDRALSGIPVVLVLEDTSDMTRLEAYRLGVSEVIPRPFTDEELCIRVRHAARDRRRPVLRGLIAEISVGTLLSLLEFERKSGVLRVSADRQVAAILVAHGQAVSIDGPPEALDPRGRLMSVLDWQEGHFEFTPGAVSQPDEIGLRTQQLLLEHARLRDERANPDFIE